MHPLLPFLALCLVVFLTAALFVLTKERKARHGMRARQLAAERSRVRDLREQSRRLAQANEMSGRGSPLSLEPGWNTHINTRPSPVPVIARNIPPLSIPRGLAPPSEDLRSAADVIERARRSSIKAIRPPVVDEPPWEDTVPDDPEKTTVFTVHPLTLKPIR